MRKKCLRKANNFIGGVFYELSNSYTKRNGEHIWWRSYNCRLGHGGIMRGCDRSSHLSIIHVEKRFSDRTWWLEIYLELTVAKIKELPKLERPREKAIRYGIESLSNEELLAILLRTGTKEESALDVAHKLNSGSRGLNNLFQMPYASLLDVKGVGMSKALILSACFELSKRYQRTLFGDVGKVSAEEIYHRYINRLIHEEKEVLIIVILNNRSEIIYEEEIFSGGDDYLVYSPSEIVKKVILHNGKSFYLVHNHPSGTCRASDNDCYATEELVLII